MDSQITQQFRKTFEKLPSSVQKEARQVYKVWKENPFNTKLRFKQIHPTKSIFSVRVGYNFRALGVKEEETLIWFWMGSHEDYNKLIKQL